MTSVQALADNSYVVSTSADGSLVLSRVIARGHAPSTTPSHRASSAPPTDGCSLRLSRVQYASATTTDAEGAGRTARTGAGGSHGGVLIHVSDESIVMCDVGDVRAMRSEVADLKLSVSDKDTKAEILKDSVTATYEERITELNRNFHSTLQMKEDQIAALNADMSRTLQEHTEAMAAKESEFTAAADDIVLTYEKKLMFESQK